VTAQRKQTLINWLIGIASALVPFMLVGLLFFWSDTRADISDLKTRVPTVEKGQELAADRAIVKTKLTRIESDIREIKEILKERSP